MTCFHKQITKYKFTWASVIGADIVYMSRPMLSVLFETGPVRSGVLITVNYGYNSGNNIIVQVLSVVCIQIRHSACAYFEIYDENISVQYCIRYAMFGLFFFIRVMCVMQWNR